MEVRSKQGRGLGLTRRQRFVGVSGDTDVGDDVDEEAGGSMGKVEVETEKKVMMEPGVRSMDWHGPARVTVSGGLVEGGVVLEGKESVEDCCWFSGGRTMEGAKGSRGVAGGEGGGRVIGSWASVRGVYAKNIRKYKRAGFLSTVQTATTPVWQRVRTGHVSQQVQQRPEQIGGMADADGRDLSADCDSGNFQSWVTKLNIRCDIGPSVRSGRSERGRFPEPGFSSSGML